MSLNGKLRSIHINLKPIDPNVQMLVLAEEVGEAIQEWRAYSGGSKRKSPGLPENLACLKEELADVIITASIMLLHLNENPDDIVDAKLNKILNRGGV